MAAQFQLKLNDSKEYSFNLVGKEGEVLLIGGDYPDKQQAESAIADVRVGSLMGHQLAAGKTPDGESFFVIKDTAGQVIAKSELFTSQMLFDNTLHHVKDSACIAEITDLTA